MIDIFVKRIYNSKEHERNNVIDMRRINFLRQGGGVSRSGATSNDDNAD